MQNLPNQLWLAEKSRLCWDWVYVATYIWCSNCLLELLVRTGKVCLMTGCGGCWVGCWGVFSWDELEPSSSAWDRTFRISSIMCSVNRIASSCCIANFYKRACYQRQSKGSVRALPKKAGGPTCVGTAFVHFTSPAAPPVACVVRTVQSEMRKKSRLTQRAFFLSHMYSLSYLCPGHLNFPAALGPAAWQGHYPWFCLSAWK